MKHFLFALFCFAFIFSHAQDEPVTIMEEKKKEQPPVKVFHSQKVINTKSVEVHRKGVLEFNVGHSFGDIAGDNGGVRRFYGLDNSTDIRIGFQVGLSDKLNLVLARGKGLFVTQLYEVGLKYQLLQQQEKNSGQPVSLTLFVNDVVSAQKRSPAAGQETSFENFGDRHSQVVQLLLARKCGKVSLQFNPLFLHTSYVVPNDDENIFALGGAVRLPLSKKIVILADYFHPFRSQESKDFFKSQGIKFYDPLGIGIEILTEGHVFHLNFTNATEILENRFIRRTVTNWGDGAFRWTFTISRNFILFRPKGSKGGWGG